MSTDGEVYKYAVTSSTWIPEYGPQSGPVLSHQPPHGHSKKNYKILSDWEGKQYLGLDLYLDYEKRKEYLSMITYVKNTIKRFNHKKPGKPQDQPYPHTKQVYGA